jgi:hypothetical protein
MTKNSIDRWDFGTIFCLPAKGQTAAASVAATWRDTSVVSMAAMSMANFATVSAATAIHPTVTIPTALIMAAIRSVEAAINV